MIEKSTIGLCLPEEMAFDDWLAFGKDIAAQSRSHQWAVADWAAFGFEHFPEQVEMALPEITPDPEKLKRWVAAAKALPVDERGESDMVELVAMAAKLPHGAAKPMLEDWRKRKVTIHDAKFEVMEKQRDLGLVVPADEVEEDWEYKELKALAALWNRATKPMRLEFAEMIEEADLGVIEV